MKQSCFSCRFCKAKDDYEHDQAPLGICSYTGCAVRYYEEGDDCALYKMLGSGLRVVLNFTEVTENPNSLPQSNTLVVVYGRTGSPVIVRRDPGMKGFAGAWEIGRDGWEVELGDLWAYILEKRP